MHAGDAALFTAAFGVAVDPFTGKPPTGYSPKEIYDALAALTSTVNSLATTVNNPTTGLAAVNTIEAGFKKELMTRAKTIVFTNITATASKADTAVEGAANPGLFNDYLTAGSYKPIAAYLETVNATLGNTTISILSGSTKIVEATLTLTALPALGNLLNLAGLASTTMNPFTVPATPTATSSAGGKFKLTLLVLPV